MNAMRTRMSMLLAAASVFLAGCMTSPFGNQVFSSPAAPVGFAGCVPGANELVYLQSCGEAACRNPVPMFYSYSEATVRYTDSYGVKWACYSFEAVLPPYAWTWNSTRRQYQSYIRGYIPRTDTIMRTYENLPTECTKPIGLDQISTDPKCASLKYGGVVLIWANGSAPR
jgi:hypothetical protein